MADLAITERPSVIGILWRNGCVRECEGCLWVKQLFFVSGECSRRGGEDIHDGECGVMAPMH